MSAAFPSSHPLPSGTLLPSLGGHFTYRIVGPCCRLFDREQLPWPCCRLQWRGKEPSWRRIGRRFTPDLAVQRSPSYAVEILEPGHTGETVILTVYSDRLTPQQRDWWYSKRKNQASADPPPSRTERPESAVASTLSPQLTKQQQPDQRTPSPTRKDAPRIFQCILPL